MKYFVLYDDDFRQETITGSIVEDKVVDKLVSILKEYVDEIDIVKTPVDSWIEEECFIEVGDQTVKCYSMPYTLPADVEAYPVSADYFGGYIASSKPVKDSIVLIPFPEDPDDIKYVVLKLYEYGARAVVFYDQLPGRYRRMVLIGDEDYSHTHGAPTPIPAVSIRKEDYLKISKINPTRIRIHVKNRVIHNATGKTIIARIHGRGEEEIHVSAHHDHWFTGFSDNLVGVEILVQLAMRYHKEWNGVNLALISYTAEESGAPNYTSWYWTWGSRYYLEILDKTNNLDKIIADINIDTIYTTPLSINGNPALLKCIEEITVKYPVKYRGYDHTDFDSFSYTMKGIPALTINNLLEMKHIYHTNLDDGEEVSGDTINKALTIADEIIKCVNRCKPRYSKIIEYLKRNNHYPSEYRNLVGRLENLGKIIPDENKRIRITTEILTAVSYIPGIDGLFEADLLGDIKLIVNLLENLKNNTGKRIRVKAVDREQILDISPTHYNLDELEKALNYALRQRIQYYHRQLDEAISRVVSKKHFKPSTR